MNKQSVLIFKLPELFKILNELKDHLDFNIFNLTEKQELLNLNKDKFENYLVLTNLQNQIKDEKFQLILNKLPDTFHSIIEKINFFTLHSIAFSISIFVSFKYFSLIFLSSHCLSFGLAVCMIIS